MDYTLSTFLPECSLSQEPKTRQEIEGKIGLPSCNTSMPLLMHLINMAKNKEVKAPVQNNFMASPDPEKAKSKSPPAVSEKSKNLDLKPQLEETKKANENTKPNSNLSDLNNLPPLTQKKGLQPLDFNPKEDDKEGDNVEKEKKKLEEVDKKMKQFEKGGMKVEMDRQSPDKVASKFSSKVHRDHDIEDDYVDDWHKSDLDSIPESPNAMDHLDDKDKNPEFTESGVSQSMGMDPSVNSLDIEDYDHIEKAIISSPYKA